LHVIKPYHGEILRHLIAGFLDARHESESILIGGCEYCGAGQTRLEESIRGREPTRLNHVRCLKAKLGIGFDTALLEGSLERRVPFECVVVPHTTDKADTQVTVAREVVHERPYSGLIVWVYRRNAELRRMRAHRHDRLSAGLNLAQICDLNGAQERDNCVDMIHRVGNKRAWLFTLKPLVALAPLRPRLDRDRAAAMLLNRALDAQQYIAEELIAQERAEHAYRWPVSTYGSMFHGGVLDGSSGGTACTIL
jgi:hypothetical protein